MQVGTWTLKFSSMTAPVSDGDAFVAQFDLYRHELLTHCYRMMGSIQDAEDVVQEIYIRAWRGYSKFEGRSSMRTWLYRIATNTCLTALEGQSKRALPSGLGAPSSDPPDNLIERREVTWLEPIGGWELRDSGDPAGIVAARESIRLAFAVALQHLSARQRAALLMREVLQWKASEIAKVLATTTTAINSLLQRARDRLDAAMTSEDCTEEPSTAATQELLMKYVDSFERYDIDQLVTLFTSDAVWEMPLSTGWYQGKSTGPLIPEACPAREVRV